MRKSKFESSPRQQTRLRLMKSRRNKKGEIVCEICGRVAEVVDLHEVFNRSHYPPDMINEVPDVLLALVCHECNGSRADRRDSRVRLVKAAIRRYGADRVLRDSIEFLDKLSTGGAMKDLISRIVQEAKAEGVKSINGES